MKVWPLLALLLAAGAAEAKTCPTAEALGRGIVLTQLHPKVVVIIRRESGVMVGQRRQQAALTAESGIGWVQYAPVKPGAPLIATPFVPTLARAGSLDGPPESFYRFQSSPPTDAEVLRLKQVQIPVKLKYQPGLKAAMRWQVSGERRLMIGSCTYASIQVTRALIISGASVFPAELTYLPAFGIVASVVPRQDDFPGMPKFTLAFDNITAVP